MEMEWDEEKRKRTLEERALDFADLASYNWAAALDRADPRDYPGEERRVSIGYLGDRLVVIAYTFRGDRLRVISLRKANAREQKAYG